MDFNTWIQYELERFNRKLKNQEKTIIIKVRCNAIDICEYSKNCIHAVPHEFIDGKCNFDCDAVAKKVECILVKEKDNEF